MATIISIFVILAVICCGSFGQDGSGEAGKVRMPSFLSKLTGQMSMNANNGDQDDGSSEGQDSGRQFDLNPPENAQAQPGPFLYDTLNQLNPFTRYIQQAQNTSESQNQTIIAIFIPVPVAQPQFYGSNSYGNMPPSFYGAGQYGNMPEMMGIPAPNDIPPQYQRPYPNRRFGRPNNQDFPSFLFRK